jgi:nucleoside-diphosphate-sugar epimerase
MRKKVILVTGAAGEIGLALILNLVQESHAIVLSLDLQALPESMSGASTHIQGDILDRALLSRLVSEYEIETIYHLAAC